MHAMEGVLGAVMVWWGYWHGIRLKEPERAKLFQGCAGFFANMMVILGGASLLYMAVSHG